VLALWLARPTPATSVGGAVLVLSGLALRLWAAGFLEKGGELCLDGPYRYVRHPLYLGSLLAALGFAVAMNVIWGWVVVLPLFLGLYLWQVLDEERHLRNTYGEEHAAFRASVPMLLPRPWRPAAGKGRPYRWSQARANREHYHALFTLLFVALFFLKTHFR
jgi:protein-S-isoprenylcysteine O-methyltransferase Ste14